MARHGWINRSHEGPSGFNAFRPSSNSGEERKPPSPGPHVHELKWAPKPKVQETATGWEPQLQGQASLPGQGTEEGRPRRQVPFKGIRKLTADIMGSSNLDDILGLVEDNLDSVDFIHLAAAVTRAGRILSLAGQRSLADEAVFLDLLDLARPAFGQMGGQALSNVLYSMAKSGVTVDPGIILDGLQHAEPKLSSSNTQELSNILWALAKLRYHDDSFVQKLLAHARLKLSNFNSQDLSNTLWALATMDYHDEPFVQELLIHAGHKLSAFNTQELANTLWALGTLGHRDDSFVQQLLIHAGPELPSFNAQEFSNVLWALATMDHCDDLFVQQLLVWARPKLADFNSQELSNTLWALATLSFHEDAFVRQLLTHAQPKLSDFTSQGLANTLWALATLSYHDDAFVRQLLSCAQPKLSDYNSQAFINSLWALATLRYRDNEFVRQLLIQAGPKLYDSSPLGLSITLWSLATLRHSNASFLKQILAHAKPKLSDFTSQNLSNLAWALAVFDCASACGPRFVSLLLSSMMDKLDNLDSSGQILRVIEADQWSTFFLFLDDNDKLLPRALAANPRLLKMRQRCDDLRKEVILSHLQSSRAQLKVLSFVRQLPGCSGALSEYAAEDGMFGIDIALLLKEGTMKVAIEVDGPTRFFSNEPEVMDGSSALRNRLLESRGWRVVSVRTAEWKLIKGKEARLRFLRGLLQPVVGF